MSDVNGETAVMRASLMGHGDDVKYPNQAGADIKVRDILGETAVMLVTFKGHGDIVECLHNVQPDVQPWLRGCRVDGDMIVWLGAPRSAN